MRMGRREQVHRGYFQIASDAGCYRQCTVLYFLLGFLPFSFLFPELRGCGGTVRDMGTRIWEYGIFGVPMGWYCIMTMGFTCAFP